MHLRFKALGRKVYIGVSKQYEMLGVNSLLTDGQHCLMWDFDDVPLPNVRAALARTCDRWKLSEVHILQSSYPSSYHAYCWTRMPWQDAFTAVYNTDYVDPVFAKFGLLREFFTLRRNDKRHGVLRHVAKVTSEIAPTVNPYTDMQSHLVYETKKG